MGSTLLFLLVLSTVSVAQERSAVFGVVRDAQTQMPIEGAKVYLSPYDLRLPDPLFPTLRMVTDSFIGFETTTDAGGRYRLSSLPPHRYCLGAEKEGYWWIDDYECQQRMIRTSAGLNLEKGLTLDRAPVLRGRFLDDSTNLPITGLRLIALQQRYASGMQQWTSSYGMKPGKGIGEFEMRPPRGAFYLEIVPNESEKIEVRPERRVSTTAFYGRSYYPNAMDIAMATPFVFAPGQDRFLEIRVPRREPKSVSVEIAGVPNNARVQLALERRTAGYYPPTLARASVNAGDLIDIEGLSVAEYSLVAWTEDVGAGRMGIARRFSAGDIGTAHLKLRLEPTLTLTGIVRVDTPSSAAPIGELYFDMRADDRENPGEGFSQVKIAGASAFNVKGLLPGKYQVYAGPPPGWVVSKMQFGTLDAIHQIFTLESAARLVITLSRRFGAVTGSLTDGTGPMNRAALVLVPEPMPQNAYVNSFQWTHLDESGQYQFKNVVPGRYRVIPFYESTLGTYLDLNALREHARGYREVVVQSGKTSSGVNFASPR